jgi:hypothetical protein
MNIAEFENYMINKHNAYWVSPWIAPRNKVERIRLDRKQYNEEIQQIDYIGLSRGNESLMIELTVWAGDVIQEPIEITCKMLGSNLKECFSMMNDILENVHTCYCSVN